MKPGWRGFLLRAAVSLGSLFLVFFFLHDKLSESLQILKKDVRGIWLGFSFFANAVGLSIISWRFKLVLKIQGILVGFFESFYLNFISLFFNLFFPSAVGGDIAKAYYVYKHSGRKIESTTSVILDRLLGFVALILMAVLAVFLYGKKISDPNVSKIVFGFLAVMLVTVIFFLSKRFARVFRFIQHWIPSKKWRERLENIYHVMYDYKNHVGFLAGLVALSFLGQVFFIMVYYFAMRSLGLHLTPWIFFILIPVLSIVSMAPSLGGLGVREAGIVYFFKNFMSAQHALALTVLIDLVTYGYSFLAGIIFSIRGGLKAKVIHEMEEIQ